MMKPRDPRLDLPCARPYQLVNPGTGEVIALPCGSRLDAECPSCAVRYQIVQRRILDEGQPAMPTSREMIDGTGQLPVGAFVTLTLGSYGILTEGHAPKYPTHYRYGDAVVAAALERNLERSWERALRRATRDWEKAGFRIAYRGAREVQERGAGHLHLVVTLDPNTEDWDGVTRAPSPKEFAERIGSITAGTTAIPADLRAHIASPLVLARRQQVGLMAPTRDTLRITPRLRYGTQLDVQPVNLHSDPTTDGQSFSRKAAYVSKAFAYLTKDLGEGTCEKVGRRNRTHLNRLRAEAFALLADYRATETVRRWLDLRIAETCTAYRENPTRRTWARLQSLWKARRQVVQVVAWNFLDEVVKRDLLGDHPLSRLFRQREQRAWIAWSIGEQLGMDDILLEDMRYLVKNLGTVLLRIVRFNGHSGSPIVSSRWPVTATAIRETQRVYAVAKLAAAGVTVVSHPPGSWEPLHRARAWHVGMTERPAPWPP